MQNIESHHKEIAPLENIASRLQVFVEQNWGFNLHLMRGQWRTAYHQSQIL
jgi:hypothetical protein